MPPMMKASFNIGLHFLLSRMPPDGDVEAAELDGLETATVDPARVRFPATGILDRIEVALEVDDDVAEADSASETPKLLTNCASDRIFVSPNSNGTFTVITCSYALPAAAANLSGSMASLPSV